MTSEITRRSIEKAEVYDEAQRVCCEVSTVVKPFAKRSGRREVKFRRSLLVFAEL